MKWLIAILVPVLLPLFFKAVSVAKTADGETPAVEDVCDAETGAAYGLCNAYCEAMDCDSDSPNASEQACERVAKEYQTATMTQEPPPCGEPAQPECLCVSLLVTQYGFFEDIFELWENIEGTTTTFFDDAMCSFKDQTLLYEQTIQTETPPYLVETRDLTLEVGPTYCFFADVNRTAPFDSLISGTANLTAVQVGDCNNYVQQLCDELGE